MSCQLEAEQAESDDGPASSEAAPTTTASMSALTPAVPASVPPSQEAVATHSLDPPDPDPRQTAFPITNDWHFFKSNHWRLVESATEFQELDPPYCYNADLPRAHLEAAPQYESDPLDIPDHERPLPVSDGSRMVVAEYISRPGEQDVALKVTITEGDAATVHVLPMGLSTGLLPSVLTRSRASHIVLAPDRWFIPVSVLADLEDLYGLVRWHLALEADSSVIDDLDPYGHRQTGESGVNVKGWIGLRPDGLEHFDCFITWEELGITAELYDKYGAAQMANKYRPSIDQLSGYIWTARWGEEPVRAELPDSRGRCCRIDVLDSGFVAISQTATSEYSTAASAPLVHYSRDGVLWEAVVVPTYVYSVHELFGPAEVPIWVCSAESTDTGVLVRQAIGDAGPHSWTPLCGDGTYWSADGDLTNWRKLLAPPPGYD